MPQQQEFWIYCIIGLFKQLFAKVEVNSVDIYQAILAR